MCYYIKTTKVEIMNKKILALLVVVPTLLLAGCKYDNFGGLTSSVPAPSSSEEPSSSSEEEIDPYAVSLDVFNEKIRKMGAVTFESNFTANVDSTLTYNDRTGSFHYVFEGDYGKYRLHNPEEPETNDMFYVYNPNSYNPYTFKCDLTMYSYNDVEEKWETRFEEGDYFFPFFALLGFPYRDLHYDRFVYNQEEHKYTCPVAIMTEDGNQVEMRDITLMFEYNNLVYSELTMVDYDDDNPTVVDSLLTYKVTFTNIGTTTVTVPTV